MKFVFLFTFFCSLVAFGQTPKIANRPPKPDELGYLPSASKIAPFNPPSFGWLHEPNAVKYDLQWSTDQEFRRAASVTNLNFNAYTHHRPLPSGTYFWRYRYTTRDGKASEWSQTRAFNLPKSATEFPMPSFEERRKRIGDEHPRLFVTQGDLAKLRLDAKGRLAAEFAGLQAAADRVLSRPITAEPAKMGSVRDRNDKEAIANWWPNRIQAVRACMDAELVAFVYLITQDAKYGAAARERILALASWDPDGPTNFRMNCEAAKPLLHRIARAYDWAYEALSDSDRKLVRNAVTRRIKDAWESGEVGRGVGHLNRPLSSHGNRTWHKIGESGIVFLGEIPDAELWLDYALNKYFTCYPVWSDSDGGWHEGVAYLGGYMSKAVWWLQAADVALDLDPLKKPFFSQVGDFPLYVAPPFSPNAGFGDLSYGTSFGGWGEFMEFFTREASVRPNNNAAQWRWWCEQWNGSEQTGVLGFLYDAMLPSLPPSAPPTNLPVSKVFHGIGVASLHTTLLNSSNDVHLLFKSSPYGSQSHGHNPQNTFQLNAYGDALLTSCVYRDLHGSPFHYKWAHETIAQNGVLVNGKGQNPHSASSRGEIIAEQLTPEWDYIAGDAKAAYGKRLERALRHVLFVKPGLIVIYDDLVAPEPAQFQFMLHGLSEFAVDEANSLLKIQRPKAGAAVQYLGSTPVKFRQWDGYDPKPTREFPNQWHVEASTSEKQKAVRMFTVITPHRGKEAPQANVRLLESKTAHGLEVKLEGERIVLGFRNADVNRADLGGNEFNSPVFVRRVANK